MIQRLFPTLEDQEYWFHEGCHIVETLNDPADPHCSIVRARVEPGDTTQWHWLEDTWERYVIQSGHGIAFVGDDRFEVGPGDIVLIPPATRQRINSLGSSDLVFLAVCTPRFQPGNYHSD